MISPAVEAVVLGAIQGLTEFLPISSDGHLALAQILFHTSDASLTVTVMLHVGTLLATLIVLRERVLLASKSAIAGLRRPALFREDGGGRDALFVVIASVPTALIGLFGRDAVASLTASPLAVAFGFLGTGVLLISSRFAPAGTEDRPAFWKAFLIGTAQGFAVLPGLSRSGSTIVLALWLGIRPARAFELSMLVSLPAVVGAVALESRHVGDISADAGSVVLGTVVAFVVGVLALNLLRRTLVGGWFPLFALWVIPLGFATMALAWAMPSPF